MMHISSLVFRGVAAMGLLGVGLTACQWVAGIEDIELTGGSSSAGSSSGAGTGGTTGASSSSASASSSASGPKPPTVTYKATVADCMNIDIPNPDTCESECGTGQMRIDDNDSGTGSQYHVFLRFDLDDALAGRTVVAVTLSLSTTAHPDADSDRSGEIWQVEPFARTDLFTTVPADVGSAPVADDLGGVKESITYKWSPLPTTLVAANMPVYLRLKPRSSNTAWYWNTKGTTPPELIIDLQ